MRFPNRLPFLPRPWSLHDVLGCPLPTHVLFPFPVLLLNRLLISLVAQKSWAWSHGKEG